ncbi:MAG TPA: AraC family transcriptional regulator N-terminal domain-containing protein [Roseiflexaceae bacterium]|nr:AraC family transcriptional regulator N-terminal domain-containing protein [Roseiflexaceae bacterium]
MQASREGVVVRLAQAIHDPALIGSVINESGCVAPRSQAAVTAMDVSLLDMGLVDAVGRLVRLLEAPSDAGFLVPLLKREMVIGF